MTENSSLHQLLAAQRDACLSQGPPTYQERLERIDRLIYLLTANAEAFVEALRQDFGHRAPMQSLMTDVLGVLMPIKHTRRHLRSWMRPQRKGGALQSLVSGRARVEWVPRGVVGIIAPWNFPVALAVQPLAAAFAAGNRAMLKLSEFAPRSGELLKEKIAEQFDDSEAVAVTGGPEVGAAFSRLPFDLVFFTGATGIARHVLQATAGNLAPTVLELGGKSPVVIGPNADLALAAQRIAFGKTLNAGQICLSPDHVFVPAQRKQAFMEAMADALAKLYPSLLGNEDYSSIVNERHYQRLQGYVRDAQEKGATVVEVNPAGEDFSAQPHHKMPPTLLGDASAEMLAMQEEIFGPLLPVLGYEAIDEVIDQVNRRPRPLATYYFGQEDATCRRFLDRTISGGVTINDVLLHVMNEDLPFGGVGDSGMGYYHGRAGFEAFCHPRSIASAPGRSPNKLVSPPYGRRFRAIAQWLLRREMRNAARRLARNGAKVVDGGHLVKTL